MLFALCFLVSYSRQSRLERTLAWMETSYNDREGYAGHSRMNCSPARFETEFDSDGYVETLSHNGCKLTTCLQDNARSRTIRDISGTLTDTVDLRDIDVRSIHLQRLSQETGIPCDENGNDSECGLAMLTLATRGGRPVIQSRAYSDWEFKIRETSARADSNASRMWMPFDDTAYARRFRSALIVAVKLCER